MVRVHTMHTFLYLLPTLTLRVNQLIIQDFVNKMATACMVATVTAICNLSSEYLALWPDNYFGK